MDTQERVRKISRFVILTPHRDALQPLEAYRRGLFAAAFPGAYSFPLAAPIAAVSRPFAREELKELAAAIRGVTGERKCGKIQSAETSLVQCPPFSFLGILLDFPLEETLFPQAAREKLLAVPPFPALCAALVCPGEENRAHEKAPPLSFRTAFVANLAVRALPCGGRGYSFEWNIGPPVWLPKNGKPRRGGTGIKP